MLPLCQGGREGTLPIHCDRTTDGKHAACCGGGLCALCHPFIHEFAFKLRFPAARGVHDAGLTVLQS